MKSANKVTESSSLFRLWLCWLLLLLLGCISDKPNPPAWTELPLSSFEKSVSEHLEEAIVLRSESSKEASGTKAVAGLLESGKIFQAYGLHLHAAETYRHAFSWADPEHESAYLLAICLRDLGRPEEAKETLGPWIKTFPDHINSRLMLAQIDYEAARYDSCIGHLQHVLSLDPDSVPALGLLGQVRLQEGNHAEAIDVLEKALDLSPGASALRYPLGLAYRSAGELELAQEQMALRGIAIPRARDPWLSQVLALRRGGRVHLNEGTLYFSEGLYARAEASFLKALEQDPESPTVHLNLGSTRVKLGRLPQARIDLLEAIRLDPELALAWFDLGVIEAQEGADDEAVLCYDRALEIDSNHVEALFNRGNALRRMGDYGKAVSDFDRLIELVPGNAMAWLAGAVCHIRLDQAKEAQAWIERSLKVHPQEVRLMGIRWRLMACDRNVPRETVLKELDALTTLTRQKPDLELLEARAMLLAASGQFEIALALQKALIKAAAEAQRPDLAKRLIPHENAYSRNEFPFDAWPE